MRLRSILVPMLGMMRRRIQGALLVASVVFAVAAVAPARAAGEGDKPSDEQPVRIGVLAFRGTAHAVRSWTPMTRYLTSRIAGTHKSWPWRY